MNGARRLTTVILIAAPALLAAASGCVFDVFRLPETALPTEEAGLDQAAVSSLAYSADGSQLASAHENLFPGEKRVDGVPAPPQIRLWNSATPGYPPKALWATFWAPFWDWYWPRVGFSTDGKRLYTATQKGLLCWDIPEQRLTKWFEGYHVSLSPNGRTVARRAHERPAIEPIDLDNSPDGKPESRLNSPKDEPKIELVDIDQPTPDFTVSANTELVPLGFSSNGELLACYDYDSHVLIWHIPSQSRRCQIGPVQGRPMGVFSPDGHWFAAQDLQEGPVGIWNTTTGARQGTFPTGRAVWCLAFSPDGQVLAVGREGGGRRGEIQLWNVNTARQIATMTDRSTWGITALCFSPDSATLASGNGDGVIKFWPVAKASK